MQAAAAVLDWGFGTALFCKARQVGVSGEAVLHWDFQPDMLDVTPLHMVPYGQVKLD